MGTMPNGPPTEPNMTDIIRAQQIAKLLKGNPELETWVCEKAQTEQGLREIGILLRMELMRTG